MTVVRWTQRALRDLVDIGDFIAQDSPEAARDWVEQLRERAQLAAQAPKLGRKVPEVDHDDIRETFLRSYRIVYRIVRGAIVVLTVLEGHRQFPSAERGAKAPGAPETPRSQSKTRAAELRAGKKARRR